jgi:hypothetical protein
MVLITADPALVIAKLSEPLKLSDTVRRKLSDTVKPSNSHDMVGHGRRDSPSGLRARETRGSRD